jgi:release factor glutamine methyltransferase
MHTMAHEQEHHRISGGAGAAAAPPGSLPDTAGGLLRWARVTLTDAGIANAGNEAGWLLECALGVTRLELVMHRTRRVPEEERAKAVTLIRRRAAREPLQYLLGTQEFCGLEFEVGPAALIPRRETELLVEAIRGCPLPSERPLIADMGTGSGCIAVALAQALPGATVYAVDRSRAALDLARRNAARHGMTAQVVLLEGDLCEPLRHAGLEGALSAMVSNPPYIPDGELSGLQPEVSRYEPRLALAGGADGLGVLQRLITDGAEFLLPCGVLVLEVGQGQAPAVRRLALEQGDFKHVQTRLDDQGIERVVCFRRKFRNTRKP